MTEPTTDPHLRRLHAIAGNAVGPALGASWWLPLGVRETVGRAVVQALLDAGAIPPPPPEPGTPRHTASDITDDQLAALYGELDGVYDDLTDARRHNDETCEAVQRRDTAEAAVHRMRKLHHLDHLYEVDCPCPAPGDDSDDDAYDAYWERHHRDDDGEVACLNRPVADICPTCIDRNGDPHPWPCETGTALDNREPK